MTIEWLVVPIIFVAIFVQSIAGFGSGLIAMPFLIGLLGLDTAAPAFALIAQTGGLMIFLRYRSEWNLREIWRVLLAAVICIPLGVWGVDLIDERLVKIILGIVTLGYALYKLLGLDVPEITNKRWGFGFGMASGLLSGAYNTGGPPLVIYGTSQRWRADKFRANITSIFFPGGVILITSHMLAGNMTRPVLVHYGVMLPAVISAMLLGFFLDRYINQEQFRTGVLVLLVVIGVTLIV